jgi:hypothetical protein
MPAYEAWTMSFSDALFSEYHHGIATVLKMILSKAAGFRPPTF